MRIPTTWREIRWSGAAAALVALTACGDVDAPVSPESGTILVPAPARPLIAFDEPAPVPGQVKVCKVGNRASFYAQVRNGPAFGSPLLREEEFVLDPGACRIVDVHDDPNAFPVNHRIDVWEMPTNIYAGPQAPRPPNLEVIHWKEINGAQMSQNLNANHPVANTINWERGTVATFYNYAACDVGFWRQSENAGEWPAPYTTSTPFRDVFGVDAFPGASLLQVVSASGGKEKALGRQAVAAVLNAAHAEINFDRSAQQVIDAFNTAYLSGSNSQINSTAKSIEEANSRGCPLNLTPIDDGGGDEAPTAVMAVIQPHRVHARVDVSWQSSADVVDIHRLTTNGNPGPATFTAVPNEGVWTDELGKLNQVSGDFSYRICVVSRLNPVNRECSTSNVVTF